MPPLLGRPEGQNEMAVDLKDIDLKSLPEGQNEMAVDLKDVDLKDVDLKSQPARQNSPGLSGQRKTIPRRSPGPQRNGGSLNVLSFLECNLSPSARSCSTA